MNKKIIFISSIILLSMALLSFCLIKPAYSDLKDFKDDYKKEESSKKQKNSSSKSSSSDSSDDSCAEMCILFLPIWIEANASLKYSSYPYSHEQNNFICNYPDEEYVNQCFDDEGSSWYLTLESGGQYAFDNGNAGFARLSGKIFKFFGPEFEFKRLVDDNNDKLDYYAFGINIPIFQFSGFSPDIYVQASYLRGVIERDGISYGIIINSYPIDPISLMFRFGVQSFGNIKGEDYGSMDFYDYEGRLGIIFYRLEIFGGYRHIRTELTKIHGPIAGIRIFI
jgi:hypothetical protein